MINSARGAVVDTEAVKNALKESNIGGYVADVWENEPNVDRTLLRMTSIATPHIAGYSVEGKFNATSMIVNAVANFIGIRPVFEESGNLPPPEKVSLDCENNNPDTIIREIYRTVCPVMKETEKLKKGPEAFLDLRKNYALRRDNKNLTLQLKNCIGPIKKQLQDIEFKIEKS